MTKCCGNSYSTLKKTTTHWILQFKRWTVWHMNISVKVIEREIKKWYTIQICLEAALCVRICYCGRQEIKADVKSEKWHRRDSSCVHCRKLKHTYQMWRQRRKEIKVRDTVHKAYDDREALGNLHTYAGKRLQFVPRDKRKKFLLYEPRCP